MWKLLRRSHVFANIISSSLKREFSYCLPAASVVANNDTLFTQVCNICNEIWDGLLLAAPKKRRSISKRKYLRKFKALKPRDDIEDCVVCGGKKLCGKLCHNCFQWTMSLTEKFWENQKQEGGCRKDRYVRAFKQE